METLSSNGWGMASAFAKPEDVKLQNAMLRMILEDLTYAFDQNLISHDGFLLLYNKNLSAHLWFDLAIFYF